MYTFFWAGLGSSWPKLRVTSPDSRYELLNRHLVLLLNKSKNMLSSTALTVMITLEATRVGHCIGTADDLRYPMPWAGSLVLKLVGAAMIQFGGRSPQWLWVDAL